MAKVEATFWTPLAPVRYLFGSSVFGPRDRPRRSIVRSLARAGGRAAPPNMAATDCEFSRSGQEGEGGGRAAAFKDLRRQGQGKTEVLVILYISPCYVFSPN